MNKRNLIIGIIVLIALVGGVALWQQKNKHQDTKQQIKKEVAKQAQEQKITKEQKKQTGNQRQTTDGKPKPEEKIDTSDWKTYYNKNCRLQFKYPPNYHLIRYAEKPNDCNVWVTKRLGSNPGRNIRVHYATSFAWKDVYLKCNQQSEKYKNIRWFFSCHDIDKNYESYKRLTNYNSCDDISLDLADKKHLLENNVEHDVILECQDGNTNDAKTIKEILRSFKFF